MENSKTLELILSELKNMNTRFDSLESRMDKIENRFDNLENRINVLEKELKDFRKETKDNLEVINMQIFVTQKFVLSNKDRIESLEFATLDNLKETKN